ncbi:hypothetical protein E2P81_ATG05383 [Venturia nashicola]|uniref:Uncharacterized protein n=1 Tax=Venturia nashicola TaxID=86259 RepID=A0A4Z1PGL0_9PEZI|nr:hypothetical protein E6O75_ATG05518 [Venturia nashicola]TLD32407.1 hypothetical protein E2P81_ATG05383 [Venturia nashicola]
MPARTGEQVLVSQNTIRTPYRTTGAAHRVIPRTGFLYKFWVSKLILFTRLDTQPIRDDMKIQPKYRCIGKGFCGSVWASESFGGSAMKREDGWPGRSVKKDYEMHK